MIRLWNSFWFKPAPYLDLAIFRVLAVGATLILSIQGLADLNYVYSLELALYDPLPVLKVLLLPLGFEWGGYPPKQLMVTAYWLSWLFGISALLGFRTNISLLLFAVLNILIQSFEYSFNDIHHRQAVMMVALLALSLSPCGRVLSIDNRMGKGHNKWVDSHSSDGVTSCYAGWPVSFLIIFFSLMYWSAITSKLVGAGLDWANGWTLQFEMARDAIRHGSPFAAWVSQHHNFLHLSQYVTLAFQSTFILIVFFPVLRWIYIPLGLFFHTFILLTLKAPFYHWIVLYFAFIPWSQVFLWIKSKFSVEEQAIV